MSLKRLSYFGLGILAAALALSAAWYILSTPSVEPLYSPRTPVLAPKISVLGLSGMTVEGQEVELSPMAALHLPTLPEEIEGIVEKVDQAELKQYPVLIRYVNGEGGTVFLAVDRTSVGCYGTALEQGRVICDNGAVWLC